MILRRAASPTSLLKVPSPSPDASPCPSVFSAPSVASWEDDMSVSTEQASSSRPVSAVPSKIPSLRDILANRSVPPYTLSAFTAYLSQKQCLENLEFTMEARRYSQKYDELAAEMTGMPMSTEIDSCRELSHTWQRLLDAYISSGARKEVNLPDHIRRDLLQHQDRRGSVGAPPAPEILDRAVDHVYELMNDSIMMGFISEMTPKPPPAQTSIYHAKSLSSNELGISGLDNDDDRRRSHHHSKLSLVSHSRNRSRSRQKYSPEHGSGSEASFGGSSSVVQPPRISTSNTSAGLSTATSRRSIGSGTSGDVIMEDASNPSSPSDMMTPPTTPPGGELGGGGSPRSRDGNTFRKFMDRIGGKKKPSSR